MGVNKGKPLVDTSGYLVFSAEVSLIRLKSTTFERPVFTFPLRGNCQNMSIKLAVAGRSPIELADESISLGSDPTCTVTFPMMRDVKPKHAVIRMIAGRWLIEVREAEAVYVGGPEPKRLFWLNPGDVIRLTEDGPPIIFQPQDGPATLQVKPAPPQAKAPQLPEVDAPLTRPSVSRVPKVSDVILPPDSTPSLPVTKPGKPPSSAAIRVPKAPSSGSLPVSKAPLSGTIPTTRAPLSGTIPASKAPLSGTIRTTSSNRSASPPKLSRSGSNIPATGEKLKRSGSQVPIPKSSDDEPNGDVPTLQRMSSWDDSSERRGLTEEQAEMRWIMMIVGRSIGAGLVILILWIAVSWVMKSMKPSQFDPVPSNTSSNTSSIEQNVVPPGTPSSSPPTATASANADVSRPKPTQPRESKPKKKRTTETSPDTTMTDAPKSADPSEVAETSSAVTKPDTEKPMSEESSSNPKPELEQASPAKRAVQEGIYAVMIENSDKSRRIQLGTAWAVSRRSLVTSATVVAAIEEYRQQGMIASVVQFATDKEFRIKSERMHDSYRKAAEAAEKASERRDDTRFAAERANQIRFDLGVLDVGRTERLPHKISSFTEPLDESKETAFIMVGLPCSEKEGSDPATIDVDSLKERRCKKFAVGAVPKNKEMELTIQFAIDSNGRTWAGSPVLNKDFKVIGVYSQLPQLKTTGGKPVKRESGVAWIGRLHEFASDVE